MEFTLLCNLGGPRNASVSLRLRLLHVWPTKSPGDIRIYNYYTLWVDETGVSPTSMAAGILRNLSVGKIYIINSFALSNPPNQYRACSFDLALGLSPSASFQPCVLPTESFPLDAYEFVAFSQLNMHADVVGRLSSISGISHKITNNGPAVKQTVIVEDESGAKVSITLWDEFSAVLDHVALTQADSIEAVILAFGGLLVNKLGDDYVLSSSAATHISVNPPVPNAYFLASRFAEKHEVVESLLVEFATASDATADADRRTRTLSQLLALSITNSSLEEKYRCGGVIVDVESSTPCYKLQLTLRDDSCEARFILMGGCALTLVNVSPAHLAQRFPHRPGQLPPQLHQLRGQYVKASKGKEKVSDSLLIEAPAMPFSITDEPDLIDIFPSYEGKDFRNPIFANVRNEDIDTESRVLGGSQVSVMGVQVGSTRTAAHAAMSSAVHSAVPSVQSAASMIPRRSARIEESMSPEDVGRGSSMPAAKILKPSPESSPGMTLGSTVVSPSDHRVDIERDALVDSQKKLAAKRGLFKK
ncbi:unnamed protein product [Linum trigynum]|uniref:DUF223 domain-containing protein n=1 Tax=Linum trigynum TaxID=586398 RepID=A0AAV2FT42_9ROSI